jgi:hypothetical protein
VDTLEEWRGAVAHTLREQVAMMLASNAWLAVRWRGRVADNEPGSDLALDSINP